LKLNLITKSVISPSASPSPNPDALLRNGNVLEQFLVSSQVNYTGAYLTDHLDGLTHDNVRYFLKTQRFTPRQLRQQGRSGNLPTVG